MNTYEEWGERVGCYLIPGTRITAEDLNRMYADWTEDREKIEQMQRVIDELAIGNRDAVYQRRHRKWALEKARGITAGYYYWKRLAEEGVLIAAALTNRVEAAEHKAQLAQTAWANAGVRAQQAEAGVERLRVLLRMGWKAERDKLIEERDKMAERVQQLENLGQELFYREENERLAERVRVLEGALGLALFSLENYNPNDPGYLKARAALSESSTKMEEEK